MYKGKYPKDFLVQIEKYFRDGDMEIINQKNDYIGLNHYQHTRVKADPAHLLKARGAFNDELPFGLNNDAKLTFMGWEIVPDAYYDQIMDLKNNYGDPDIYLTENGCAYPDKIDKNGEKIWEYINRSKDNNKLYRLNWSRVINLDLQKFNKELNKNNACKK